MISKFIIPKPRNEEDFEDLVADLYEKEYGDHNMQRYGRKGQSQNGVDIVGLHNLEVIGIQCKNHAVVDAISEKSVTDEIKKAEIFVPTISKYIICTSASRDQVIMSKVLELNLARTKLKLFQVEIVFWDDICLMFEKYPDVARKHILKDFTPGDLDKVSVGDKLTHKTIQWPFSSDQVDKSIQTSLRDAKQIDPFQPSVGLSSFEEYNFNSDVDFNQYISDKESLETIKENLKALKKTLSGNQLSQRMHFHLRTRLCNSFMAGWFFRKVAGYSATIVSGDDVWDTDFPMEGTSGLYETIPFVGNNQKATEVVLILNISRDIEDQVAKQLNNNNNIHYALSYHLGEGVVRNASHASILAHEIGYKIKRLSDKSNVSSIHIYGALPSALAFMIGHQLNGIKPIKVYYLGEDRITFRLGADINNKT